MDEAAGCSECGAAVADPSRHRLWHRDLAERWSFSVITRDELECLRFDIVDRSPAAGS